MIASKGSPGDDTVTGDASREGEAEIACEESPGDMVLLQQVHVAEIPGKGDRGKS